MSDAAFRFVVPSTGERLDRLVADATGRGRRIVKQWLLAGNVRVDGRIAGASDTPEAGSEVVVESEDAELRSAAPPLLCVLVEDEHRLVVAKPAGVHCERGKSAGSVAELLEQRYGDLSWIGDRAEEAGLVHRIDRDTSGVVVVARDRSTYQRLRRAFRSGATRKQYLALAAGRLECAIDVDLPISRRAARMVPASRPGDGMPARTTLEPLECGADWTLVLATMCTGVMHQVRVHLAAVGHPLIGDTRYGGPQLPGSSRRGQLLHAMRVQAGDEIDVSVGPPSDFLEAYARLKRERG
jgi:23S rRNA pseudouridine1911/1915/1917 synthase